MKILLPLLMLTLFLATCAPNIQYMGERNEKGEYHGQGTLIAPDGSKYVGEWKHHLRNGQGTGISPDGLKYVGEWKDNKYDGQGTLTFSLKVDDTIALAPPLDITNMISATIPGVRIIDTGGEVGSGGVSRIRGISSMALARTPIVVVDGVRVNGMDNETSFGGVGFDYAQAPSRLNDFNPEEIEKIEVLKGPDATILYGMEASNGVIQIITKKGIKSKAKINFVAKSGISSLLEDPKRYYNGRKYVGQWKDGKYHGQGTIIYSDGAKYVGEWKDNKYDGQGTITYANGEQWEGEFKDGTLYTGHGTYFLKGYKYIGELKDGKPTLSQFQR